MIKKFWSQAIILVTVLVFFWQVLFKGLLPIPSDTIVGLYHPFRDYYAKNYPRGIPFKNFLITDPVRQIIPWKQLSVETLARFEIPLWNPYEMAGKPHLANLQSSAFYPLNLVLFIKPYHISWTLFITIQPILAGIFMLVYLRNLKLDTRASILGAITFSFSGFSIAWLEWGNIMHTALWLPLILLSIDKLFGYSKEISNSQYQIANIHIKNKKFLVWFAILLFSSVSSFFAGHIQIFFYLSVLSFGYFLFRWFENKKLFNILYVFLVFTILFLILTAVQWIPTLQFINLSTRSLDQNYLDIEGWFIPWQHLVQFLVPDFFGNPTTLNYWGTWNYGELVGYVGIITLIFVVYSLVSGLNRTKLFFAITIALDLLFATWNPISKLPFELNIPLISSSQPTRLIFLITFGLSVLAAIGFDSFLNQQKLRKVLLPILLLVGILGLVWLVGISNVFGVSQEDLAVMKRNLFFPTVILGLGIVLIIFRLVIKNGLVKKLALIAILIVVSFDLLRFGWKFTPFTNPEYFYPQTKIIDFLRKDKSIFRVASTDLRILPPNFSTYYKIQSVEGYDPLYLKSYAQVIAASEREDHNTTPPYGFNRIITPHNVDSKIIDLLNVKYILSLLDLNSEKFEKVFQEGETIVYKNRNVLPRVFFVDKVLESKNTNETIKLMFANDTRKVAISNFGTKEFTQGKIEAIEYAENKIVIKTTSHEDGFLVLTDSYYPTWKVKIDERISKMYKTDHAFRGMVIPKGKHTVVFYDTLF